MLLELRKLTVPSGERVLLSHISWQDYEQILAELGEHRASRISYNNGILEIITPLFLHENSKVLIGDFVKILLDELELDYEPAGSTTLKKETVAQGVEPDESFYIKNCQAIRGKERIDLTMNPPPDLAIEIDITSRTSLENYALLEIPELWRYNGKLLQIYVLQSGQYVEVSFSPTFPNFDLVQKVPEFLKQSQTIGSAKVLRAFRRWVRENSN